MPGHLAPLVSLLIVSLPHWASDAAEAPDASGPPGATGGTSARVP